MVSVVAAISNLMFKLFKKKIVYPPFDALQTFTSADYYFIRTASWFWLDSETISVVDPQGPRMLTLDPWPQLVFLAANGDKTIKEYIFFIADLYSGTIPVGLDSTVLREINNLLKYGIIKLSQNKMKPAPEHDKPAR